MKGRRYYANEHNEEFSVVFLGSYDKGKPRVRNLLEGAFSSGLEVIECNADIWSDVVDKAQLATPGLRLLYLLKWLISRPKLIVNYCRIPRHKAVIFPYPGILDALLFYPFTRARRVSTVLDGFISPYDTVVNDRKFVSPTHPIAKVIYHIEALAVKSVDMVVLDTPVHARYFEKLFNLPLNSVESIPVGVEQEVFKRATYHPWRGDKRLEVLFFGQFIPLQGTSTILDAIRLSDECSSLKPNWTIIGQGQESKEFDRRLIEYKLGSVKRMKWVSYDQLPRYIASADICLGIFGKSDKALNVIPNKVYQILAVGRPLLTAKTPGMLSLSQSSPAIELVKPGDPLAIVQGLEKLAHRIVHNPGEVQNNIAWMPIIDSRKVGVELERVLRSVSRDKKCNSN